MPALKRPIAVGVAALGFTLNFAFAPAVLATQFSPPYADMFSFGYGDFDPIGYYTQSAADYAVSNFGSAGYHAFDNVDKTAATSMAVGYAQDDAIWMAIGHGNGGLMKFSTSTHQDSWLTANSTLSFNGTGNAYLSSQTFAAMHDIRLMAFIACNTGDNGSPGSYYDGNLLKVAYYGLGVGSVIGFTNLIDFPQATAWTNRYTYRLRQGDSSATAANAAMDYVWWSYLGYYGLNSWITYGGATKVVPAAYGS